MTDKTLSGIFLPPHFKCTGICDFALVSDPDSYTEQTGMKRLCADLAVQSSCSALIGTCGLFRNSPCRFNSRSFTVADGSRLIKTPGKHLQEQQLR